MALDLDDVEKTSRFNTYSSRVIDKLDDFQIYTHQRDALLQLKDWYNNSTSRIGLIVIPTGGGKSGIAALAPYVLNTTRVLVITPSLPITHQLAAAFGREPTKSFYVKQEVVAANAASLFVESSRIITRGREIEDLAENLVIVNAQKFTANSSIDWDRLNRKSFNLLIVDEAHHFPAPTWEKIVNYFHCKTIFLTATPYRRNKPIVQQQNGTICYQISCNDLMTRGIIRQMIFRQIGTIDDRDSERKSILSTEIIRILDEHDQYDPQVQHQAMVLTRNISEAKGFATQLNTTAKRPIAESYTGKMKNSDRTLQRYENGELRILVVCGKLLEGYDRKEISLCVIVRNVGSKSKVLFAQFVGRCLRRQRSDDPVQAVILSHVSYKQKPNYENLNEIAEDDPDDDDEEEEEEDDNESDG